MRIEFPFRYTFVSTLGKIFIPIVPLSLKTIDGWKEFEFILDTGADLTTLPNSAFDILGINKKNCRKSTAEGIGASLITTWETKIDLKIDQHNLKVRCAITQDDKTPFLLGRVDLLDKVFSIDIDSRKKLIIFEKI